MGSPGCGASMPATGRSASWRRRRGRCGELPYATGYFGLGSEPAIRLAAELAERAPGDLNHVYFTLGGSDAIDSTVRFIRFYFHAQGRPQKDQFISLEQGFHGSSTVGAGLTALPAFHAGFGVPFDWQHKIPSHYAYRNPVGADPAAIIAASLAALRRQGGRDRRGARRGILCRADPGLRRRAGAAAGLAEGDGRAVPRARHPVRRRRGDHRRSAGPGRCSPARTRRSCRT